MCMHASRLDSLEYEPVLVGPAFSSADILLVSPLRNATKYRTNLIEVFNKFDELFYLYTFIYSVLVITILLSSSYCRRSHPKSILRRSRKLGRKAIKILWSIFETFVDQNTYNPTFMSNRFSWLFFIMAIFFAIVGVLLNLMATDQVAQIQAHRINSVDDLLSNEFDQYQPIIMKSLFVYNLLVTAKPESKNGRLYNRIMRNMSVGVIKFNGSDAFGMFNGLSLFSDAVAGSNYNFAIAAFLYRNTFTPIFCRLGPKIVSGVYTSTDSFAEGILSFYFNKNIDFDLERYLRFQMMTFNEFGFPPKLFINALLAVSDKLGFNCDGGQKVMCVQVIVTKMITIK